MSVFFGPSGNSVSFYDSGRKHSHQMPEWLNSLGLSAYEYQCSKGCRVKRETAQMIGEEAVKFGIALSIHAPYYINLPSEGEGQEKSIGYILDTLRVAKVMGATRIVVHSGGAKGLDRPEAVKKAGKTLRLAREIQLAEGLDNICICPETMGKINQLGTLSEVLELCLVDESFIPTVDFGHLNARTFGGLREKEDYAALLDEMAAVLGKERAKTFHVHFSKIEYTVPGGEKKHLTFDDTVFGPDFEPLAELIAERRLAPTIICESDGVMAEDAIKMRDMYLNKEKNI